jgi:hypothetical protein
MDDRIHRKFDMIRQEAEEEDAEALVDRFKKKYGARADRPQGFQGDAEHVAEHMLVPSVNDPSLWLVRCRVCNVLPNEPTVLLISSKTFRLGKSVTLLLN